MLNDVFILTQIKEGNIKAFETLFRQYYTPLRLYAASITGEPDVAEEIVEELFYVFWKDREKLEIFHSVKKKTRPKPIRRGTNYTIAWRQTDCYQR